MRRDSSKRACAAAALLLTAALLAGCRKSSGAADEPGDSRSEEPAPLPSTGGLAGPAPASSAVIEIGKRLQAERLAVEPLRVREPGLAFGKGILGQLAAGELRVFDTAGYELVASFALEQPRTIVTLADGSLLAIGARTLLRFDPATKKARQLPRPTLLPGVELRPDAMSSGRVWLFDAGRGSTAGTARAALHGVPLDGDAGAVVLPDRSVELAGRGVLGTTREGVWLYLSERRAQRFGPAGAKLKELELPELPGLLWVLPARRLDQAYLVTEQGRVVRALVTPSFKQLSEARLAGSPFSADVGDEGRVLAVVVVTGAGPRFELQLFDAELGVTGRAQLPGDEPTGRSDWLQVVTGNQRVAVSAYEARVAVGGPQRVLIFDARGERLFSIPSR